MEEEQIKTDEQLKKEMIKKVDKKKIKKLIAMCFDIKDCEVLGLDQLLEEWSNQKLELYKLLGNELKIERDINMTKDKIEEIEKETGISEGGLKGYTHSEFNEFLRNIYGLSPILGEAMDRNFRYDTLKNQMPNVNGSAMSGYYIDYYFANRKDVLSFSTLMHKMFRSKEVDDIVSKYLQKIGNNIKGKMYLSIDPFDYITMSLNKSNWQSCHTLHDDDSGNEVDVGCYSAGIFSYMCDNVSVIAYKTDGEQYKYEILGRSIMAESKNWRQMVFIHPEKCYFICSRQYPYSSEILTKIIREMVEEKIDGENKNKKWKVSRQKDVNKKYIKNNGFENMTIDLQEDLAEQEFRNVGDGFEALHYNDMLHGFDYQFIYCDKKKELPKIYIGSNPNCVICGKEKLVKHSKPICFNCRTLNNIHL